MVSLSNQDRFTRGFLAKRRPVQQRFVLRQALYERF